MIYEFMDDAGRILEADFPMSEAPDLGAVVEIPDPDLNADQGALILATRILSGAPQVRGSNWKPYISERLPRHLEGVPCTPGGKPIVSTRAQEREICAKFGYERE